MKAEFPEKLGEVFQLLYSGYHLTTDDGLLYTNLVAHIEWYKELFHQLGMTLSDGEDGIYYFEPDSDTLSDAAKKQVAFIAIMCDWLADIGNDPFTSLLENDYLLSQTPHLEKAEYIDAMAVLKVVTSDDLHNVVLSLKRAGLADYNDGIIKFRKSVKRILKALQKADIPQKESEDE